LGWSRRAPNERVRGMDRGKATSLDSVERFDYERGF
jgi:hypothetical protein